MAAAILAGAGGRTASARNHVRGAVARLAACDVNARRRPRACLIGFDAAGVATGFADRGALECAGQGVFPV